MKKSILFIALTLFIIDFSYSQEEMKGDTGYWFVSSYLGFLTLEQEDSFKTNATVVGGTVGKEFLLNDKFSILLGVEMQNITANIPNSNFHLQNQSLQLPVFLSYRLYTYGKNALQFSAGVYSGYLFHSIVEEEALSIKNTEKGLGFHFGIGTFLGYKHYLNESLSFQLGLTSRGDFLQSYNEDYQKFKIKNLHAIQMGILVRL